MAAAEESLKMVKLLLEHGANIKAANHKGRTALMEAAFWGRVDNVKVLLEENARSDVRDRKSCRAADLARRSSRNEEERYERCESAAANRVPERNADRRHIRLLLGELSPCRTGRYSTPWTAIDRANPFFSKSSTDSTITLSGSIRTYPVPRLSETVAELYRGDQFAVISAISGWSPDALPGNEEGALPWVDQVFYLASVVGHQFEPSDYDQGKHGRFSACHAEKKLIAYFIDKHVFTPKDRHPNGKLRERISNLEGLLRRARSDYPAWDEVRMLEEKKKHLALDLFNADFLYFDKEYEETKAKV